MIRSEFEYNSKDSRLFIRCPGAKLEEWRKVNDKDQKLFGQWIESYSYAVHLCSKDNCAVLLNMGQAIYEWLNGKESWMERLLGSLSDPPFIVEFRVSPQPGEKELRFLEVPWELAADNKKHLAVDPFIIYCPVRRIGKRIEPGEPSKYRLHTVFMAAAPRGEVSLRYEEEESAILDAVGSVGMDLTVEESGTHRLLAECIAGEKPVDVVHISCHGILENKNKPILMLETEEGNPCPTSAEELGKNLGGNKPSILFLSACMTSEPGSLLNSFSTYMIRMGVPAVLGWGGSVKDKEAIRFASSFYGYLSRSEHLEEALARSRLELMESDKKDTPFARPTVLSVQKESGDWHLARLYLGAKGGGILTKGQKAHRRKGIEYGHKEFLNAKDSKIPVANRREFVGRRRKIQEILREFNKPQHAGVLIHGFARQGKSSLAARIANRLTDHQVVVISEYYDVISILEAIQYFASTPGLENLINSRKDEIRNHSGNLFGVIKEVIEGPCCEKPLLFVIDDFEKVLDDPKEGGPHRVKGDYLDTMRSVIQAFSSSIGKTRCRLIFTSRYRFTLPYKGRDLALEFLPIHLPPMEEYEGKKQAAAKEKTLIIPKSRIDSWRIERCILTARGNPGLQDLLFSMCIKAPEECDKAIAAVEDYIQSGKKPDQEKLLDFIRDLAVQHMVSLLSPGEKELLRASTLFDVPVPIETIKIIAQNLGIEVKSEEDFAGRLMGFGLWEPVVDIVNSENTAVAIQALVRPQAGKLTEKESAALAGVVLKDLFERWGGEKNKKRPSTANIKLAYLALAAKETNVLAAVAEDAVWGLRKKCHYSTAAELAHEAIRVLDNNGGTVSIGLLRLACDVSDTIGDIENAQTYIARALENFSSGKNKKVEDYAYLLLTYGRMLARTGSLDNALSQFEKAGSIISSDCFPREHSIFLREIALIFIDRGEIDKALKIFKEILKIFEELGDRHSRAGVLGDIAHILSQKGDLDKAMKLHQERLEVYEELRDVRSRSITLGSIARILTQKGEEDEALKLYRESLIVFEEIGDNRSKATVLNDVSRIIVDRGKKEEALKLLQEALKLNEEMGERRSCAITMRDIARILVGRGEVDKALKLHQKGLRVFKEICDRREGAITLVDIANIKMQKREIKEAMMFLEESLKIFEELGDQCEWARTLGRIAHIRMQKGELDEALMLFKENLIVSEKLGDIIMKASTLWDIAKIELLRASYQTAFEYLSKSYNIFIKLGHLDAICCVGMDFGRLLCQLGNTGEGIKILERSREGFKKLGREDKAAGVQAAIDTFYK